MLKNRRHGLNRHLFVIPRDLDLQRRARHRAQQQYAHQTARVRDAFPTTQLNGGPKPPRQTNQVRRRAKMQTLGPRNNNLNPFHMPFDLNARKAFILESIRLRRHHRDILHARPEKARTHRLATR